MPQLYKCEQCGLTKESGDVLGWKDIKPLQSIKYNDKRGSTMGWIGDLSGGYFCSWECIKHFTEEKK